MTTRSSADARLCVHYLMTCDEGEDPHRKARDIAVEQTVELPEGCFSSEIDRWIVGRVEAVEPGGEAQWRTRISYDPVVVGQELPQLLNVVFGNVSMKAGIRVDAVEFPPALLDAYPGPQLGIEGVRTLCAAPAPRPLLCTALKPLGLTSAQLADLAHRFALGGIDIIKDDHGLADQAPAPFRERVERCQEAVERANAHTGGRSRYFPNVTGPAPDLSQRVEFARRAGCGGVLLSPFLLGLDAVRWLAVEAGVAIFAHPTFSGALLPGSSGFAPKVLLGQLLRLIGSDGVIYPNAGGRFPLSAPTCEAINAELRAPLGRIRPAFPVPGGGIDMRDVPRWVARYGADTVFLVGGSLYAQRDLERASSELVTAVKRSVGL